MHRSKTGDQLIVTKRYRALLQKRYFEKGNALMSVAKYIFLSVFLVDVSLGVLSTLAYIVLCWIIGRLWFQRWADGVSLEEVENEITNQFNRFQQEIRQFTKRHKAGLYKEAKQ